MSRPDSARLRFGVDFCRMPTEIDAKTPEAPAELGAVSA